MTTTIRILPPRGRQHPCGRPVPKDDPGVRVDPQSESAPISSVSIIISTGRSFCVPELCQSSPVPGTSGLPVAGARTCSRWIGPNEPACNYFLLPTQLLYSRFATSHSSSRAKCYLIYSSVACPTLVSAATPVVPHPGTSSSRSNYERCSIIRTSLNLHSWRFSMEHSNQ